MFWYFIDLSDAYSMAMAMAMMKVYQFLRAIFDVNCEHDGEGLQEPFKAQDSTLRFILN